MNFELKKRLIHNSRLDPIFPYLGDFVDGGKGGKIDVEWYLNEKDKLLAKDSKKSADILIFRPGIFQAI